MSRVRSILSVLCFGLVVSCMSPTLPLPPPEAPSASASATPGMVHLSSTKGAEANALILIINTNPALPNDQRVGGTFADATGSWDANVYASNGDVLHISQKFGADESSYITYSVKVP
ncbi:MAG TPA: hypothetical protein VLM85_28265 [Polyangiaceae bacterium]|nr:hypothetical protein [Polyangiaceae bacterium]